MFFLEAPFAIVVFADLLRSARRYGQRGVESYSIQDTAAAQNKLLTAHNRDLKEKLKRYQTNSVKRRIIQDKDR